MEECCGVGSRLLLFGLLAGGGISLLCLFEFSLFACAMESCTNAARCSSADGWLYQLYPKRSAAISTMPMIVFLSIDMLCVYFLSLFSIAVFTKSTKSGCGLSTVD